MSAAITRLTLASNATTATIIGFIGTLRLADDHPGPAELYIDRLRGTSRGDAGRVHRYAAALPRRLRRLTFPFGRPRFFLVTFVTRRSACFHRVKGPQ